MYGTATSGSPCASRSRVTLRPRRCEIAEQSRARLAVYDVITNRVPVAIEVDTRRRQKRSRRNPGASHDLGQSRPERAGRMFPSQAARHADFLLQNGGSLDELADRLLRFGEHYRQIVRSFDWTFTRADLERVRVKITEREPRRGCSVTDRDRVAISRLKGAARGR